MSHNNQKGEYAPLDAQRILQHFNTAHKIELDIVEGPPLALEQSYSRLGAGMRRSGHAPTAKEES